MILYKYTLLITVYQYHDAYMESVPFILHTLPVNEFTAAATTLRSAGTAIILPRDDHREENRTRRNFAIQLVNHPIFPLSYQTVQSVQRTYCAESSAAVCSAEYTAQESCKGTQQQYRQYSDELLRNSESRRCFALCYPRYRDYENFLLFVFMYLNIEKILLSFFSSTVLSIVPSM